MPSYISALMSDEESPAEILMSIASRVGYDVESPDFANFLDEIDPLAEFRQRFSYPKKSSLPRCDDSLIENLNEDCIYMCGNSLGLKPKETNTRVMEQLDKWSQMGVEMHHCNPLPAIMCDNYGRDSIGRLVGADPECVTMMNGLTVNLHLLLISFYQPTELRYKILIEKGAFPSDRYAVQSQAKMRGYDPTEAIIEVGPRLNENTVRDEDILELIDREGESIAVICLGGVQYYTGQKFDMAAITEAGHAKGCYVGWDLAHAIGNVKLSMDEWDADFACWCTYKYLNSGAGSVAGAYVNKKHNKRENPHLLGWWSNTSDTRFDMLETCDVADGVSGYKLSNPSPILVSCVLASLEIFDDAGIEQILRKQLLLTGYLEFLLDKSFAKESTDTGIPFAEIITPRKPSQRGCQLSLVFSFPLKEVHEELKKRGVVCDVRKPNVMRIAPVPLYNSYTDVYSFIQILKNVFRKLKMEIP